MTVRVVSRWDGHEFDPDGWITRPKDAPVLPLYATGCGYCGDPDKTPTTVVYGQPMRDVVTVVDSTGCRCCGDCAKPAIWLAMTEADWCRPVVVVVPIKAVGS